jgi:hypothetical protein
MFKCIEVPFEVVKKAFDLWPHLLKLAPIFNIQTKSDLLVAVKCLGNLNKSVQIKQLNKQLK